MNSSALKRRTIAAGIHLAISVVILLAPLLLILLRWYPGPYFRSDGGLYAAVILSGVHFFLGPVLTFVVFSANKSIGKIKFDLVVIGFLQLSALAYGTYLVQGQRPAAVVFAKDAFLPVSAEIISKQGALLSDLRSLSRNSPPLVYSRPPRDKEEFANMMLMALNEGIDIVQQVETFQPLADHLAKVAAEQPAIDELLRENHSFAGELQTFVENRNARREDFVYIPFNGRYRKVLFAIDDEGRLVGALYRAFGS